jgi:hypothetical protein
MHRSDWTGSSRGLSLVVLVALGVAACEARIDPAMVEAEVVAFGQYTLGDGQPELVTPGQSVPCRLGQVIGVEYRLSTRDGSTGPVPVELRWTHPKLDGEQGRPPRVETPIDQSTPEIARGRSAVFGRALWSFEAPGDLVEGRYAFEVRTRDPDALLLTRAFDVEGCPQGP